MTKLDNGFGPQRILWIAAVWFGFGLIDATQTVTVMQSEGMHHAWLKVFVVALLSWVPWVVATPFIMRFGCNVPPAKLLSYRIWPVHVGTCAAIWLASSSWVRL